jgi:hypothetical protein
MRMDDEICNVIDQASFFEEQGYFKTAEAIVALVKIVDKKQISPQMAFETVQTISSLFSNEFTNIIELGKPYRKKCFIETCAIVFHGYMIIDSGQMPQPEEFKSFIEQMNKRDTIIGPMSGSFGELLSKNNRTNQESVNMFSQACFTYTQGVGILLPVAKLLYGLINIIAGTPPKYGLCDEIWDEYHFLEKAKKIPVSLEGWPEKNAIRNAISHYQADYDPNLDLAHFVAKEPKTGKITYDKTMNFIEFYKIWMQVADAQDALIYSMRLYGIWQDLAVSLMKNS